jgi:teichuronic acid exporter
LIVQNIEDKDINSRIKRGVVWTSVDFILKSGLQFILQIILARLLVPEDFGLIGMAVVFTAIIKAFVDFGLGAALVQMREKDITEGFLNTAFWSGFGLNIVVYLIVVFIIGPFAAYFYDEPILVYIFPVLSFNIVINSFNMVQLVRLTRKMDFKNIALINVVSNIVALAGAVSLAFLGYGVWSIAIHAPLLALAALPMYLIVNKWIPKFYWNKLEFKRVFSFGLFTSGTQLTNSITSQADYLIIGKILDKQQLGVYSLAFQMTNILKASLVAVVSKVMYPVYAKLQDDKEKIRIYYAEIIKFNLLLIGPIMVFLALNAEFIVNILFGEKWIEAIPIIQILAIASFIQVLGSSNTSLIRGMGYPKLEFKIQLYKTIFIYVPSIIIGVVTYGIIGASIGIVINAILSIFIAMYFMKRLTGFTYKNLFFSTYKTFVMLLISVGIHYLVLIFTSSFILAMICFILVNIGITLVFYKKDIVKITKRNEKKNQEAL